MIRWWWRRDRAELDEARRAAESAGQRLAAVQRRTPFVHDRAEKLRQVARENNLAPLIMRHLGAGQ